MVYTQMLSPAGDHRTCPVSPYFQVLVTKLHFVRALSPLPIGGKYG
ncbi:hypothetical protein NIES4072_25810 [Nostoc commune NIES-4072]|uniref:Uncharacterized protein n=1 Tax=Nostoc commune NIES-4072 TaxID=2005467 RepID=A0A2R5FJH2_NOSCO|nr:hypothetical protein [Nostoc commune]BBD63763.1 hypothetical protein NIES4070_01050 [Nostoc commune HK-02]GBG18916.1 hypothetical protein NIES4072_25810 [Nostoc commune NIES-4072]